MNTNKVLLAPILMAAFTLGAITPANAQETGQQTAQSERAAHDAGMDTQDHDRDDGFDWGLLGLLGLLGLIPRKREVTVHRDDPHRTSNPNGPNR